MFVYFFNRSLAVLLNLNLVYFTNQKFEFGVFYKPEKNETIKESLTGGETKTKSVAVQEILSSVFVFRVASLNLVLLLSIYYYFVPCDILLVNKEANELLRTYQVVKRA